MWFLLWIAMGLVTGLLAVKILPGHDHGGVLLTAGVGVSGAFSGGFIANLAGAGGVADFSLVSLGMAAVVSTILLLIFHRVKACQRSCTDRILK